MGGLPSRIAILVSAPLLGALALATAASAACIVTGTGTLTALVTGDIVVCNNAVPNPETSQVVASTGATGITVTVGSSSGMTNAQTMIAIRSASTATNNGTLTGTGTGFGMQIVSGSASSLTNNGTIDMGSGAGAVGMIASGSSHTVLNAGAITTAGTGATGLVLQSGSLSTATNSGTIGVSGANTNAVLLNPAFAGTFTLINNQGGTISSTQGQAVLGQLTTVPIPAGTIRVENYGILTGGSGTAISGVTQLIIGATSVINGIASGTGSSAALGLGGTTNGTFNLADIGAAAQYRGFTAFRKENTSTWTLGGTATSSQTWTIFGGGLTLTGTMTGQFRTDTTANGATLTIEAGAVFTPGTSDAVSMSGGANHLVNRGTIATTNNSVAAVRISDSVGGGDVLNDSGAVISTSGNNSSPALSISSKGYTVTNRGTISTTGQSSVFSDGTIIGNTAVRLGTSSAADTMTLINEAGATISSLLGEAVSGGSGSEIVINYGTITGNQVPPGTGAFPGLVAVNLSPGTNDTLTLGATSIINGNILGADIVNLLLATNKIEDSGFDHGGTFNIVANASWILAGDQNDTGGATFNTDPGSMLTVSGGISSTTGCNCGALDPIIGTVTKNGTGTLLLSGSNTYVGAVTVNAGTMQVAGGAAVPDANPVTVNAPGIFTLLAAETVGSLAGTGAVALGGNTLTAGGNGTSTVYSGVMSGGGGFAKTGAGAMELSGSNLYSGTTTVSGGTLVVNGSIAASSALNTLAGTTLKGTGTLPDSTIAGGSTHAPGNSIGTQTVMGNYVLNGTLQVEINPNAADKVIVTGDVDITGATLDVMEETQFGWMATQSFTIIDNQGLNAVVGQFATVRNVYAFLTPSVSYGGDDGNNVVLTMVRNQLSFPAAGLTPNEQAAGGGAESLGAGNGLFDAIVPLTSAQVPAAFDQLSGEVHASIKAAGVEDSRFIREAVVQRTHRIFEDDDQLGAWMQAYGAMERRAGDGNAAAIGIGTGGLLFGGDGVGDNGWYVGVVGGIGHTRFDVPDRSSSGTSDNAHIAAYATGSLQGVILRFGAAYTQHSIQTTRTPAFQGFGETLTARYDAGTAQVFGEIGYPLDVAGLTVEPFVGLAGIFQHSNGFSETGGLSALTAPASSYQAAIASIGIRVSDSFVLGNGMEVEAFGSVAWRQAIGNTPTNTQAFAGGQNFTVASAPLSGGALNVEVGAGIKVNESTRLDLSYSGQFSGATISHAAKATLHISF